MKHALNLLWRLPLFVLHVFSGLLQELGYFLIHGKQWHSKPAGQQAIRRWMQRLCQILGLNVTVTGSAVSFHNTMIVANHVSWLDIIALASVRSIVFMAKSDVKHWPLFGVLVAASGTLFIERGNKRALKQAIDSLLVPLRHGRTVAVFPEGTTTDGQYVQPFFSGLFSAAITSESCIQPVAISYFRNGQRDSIAPYTTSDTFISHLFRILMQDTTHVELAFLSKLRTQTYTRLELATLSRAKIQQALGNQHEDNDLLTTSVPVQLETV